MVWNILLVLTVVSIVALWVAIVLMDWDPFGVALVTVFLGGGMLVTSLVGGGAQAGNVSTYKHSVELVKMKQEQRDNLASIVKEELSTEKYAALMAATPDADVLVILGSSASAVQVERAQQLVTLNSDLYSLVNHLEQKRIKICSYAENPYTPRLFTLDGCPEPIKVAAGFCPLCAPVHEEGRPGSSFLEITETTISIRKN